MVRLNSSGQVGTHRVSGENGGIVRGTVKRYTHDVSGELSEKSSVIPVPNLSELALVNRMTA